MKVGFLLYSKIHNKPDTASSRIRGDWLIKYWEGAEQFQYGQKYDAVIFQKAYLLDYAKTYKGIKILDICDPDHMQYDITEMMQECDAMTVSSDTLRDYYSQITDKPVITIKDRHDLEYFREKKVHIGKAREIVWYGYSHNAFVLKSVRAFLVKYNLGINVISDQPVILSDKDLGYDIKERFTKWDITTVNREIVKSDFTIIPGSNDPNSRFKSNNRTVNSWLLKMPVATDVQQLERFLDPIERKKEAEKNYEIAIRDYDVRISVKEMEELINNIRKEKV